MAESCKKPGLAADAQVTSTPVSDLIRFALMFETEREDNLPAIRTDRERGDELAEPDKLFFKEHTNLPAFSDNDIDDPRLLNRAAVEIYRMRRARDRVAPKGLFGEPAWDILLALYAEEPSKLPVSSVCYGCGIPSKAGLRWIGVLVGKGLVQRTLHPRDDRIVLLSLTEQGQLVVERSLKTMLRAPGG